MDNMTLEEALAAADVSTTPVNDILMVDAEARTIIVPASEMLFGVRQDMDAERKHFKCQKIVGDNVDLSNCHIYISYVPSKQDGTYDINEDVGAYLCEDLDVDGDYVTFSWKLSGNVFVKAGYIAFAVYAKQADADGNLQTKWHTTFAIGKVLDTLPDGEQIVEKYADVIEQLLNRMDEVEAIATPEAMQNYVEAYLAENPPSGMTADEKAQLQKNTEDISSLSEEIANLSGGAPTPVSVVADMTDTAKIYLYTGAEDGYIAGNWYYYDGTAWVSGGKYGETNTTEATSIEPENDDIPKVFFDEDIPQTKDDVITKFRYISKTKDVSGYAEFKAQGNSSMSYPKKNVTVKMYADEALEEKLKVDFKGWGEQRKHVYKANWIDLTHARNVVSARLWADIVKSRADYLSLPELLRISPNQGAVDGFPIKVYSQGIYQGRYTLNIPKDAWMANMDDSLDTNCILCSENYASGCFRATANINGSDWTDEVHDAVPTSIKTRWNEVISFVMNSTDEEFKANLGNYFFVDSLIDYLIFGMVSCGLDAFGKNQLYFTYDGIKWIASMYDMDSTWGLYWNGSRFVSASYSREEYEDFVSTQSSGEGNLLYIRLVKLFYAEIQARYAELKQGALSVPNIINHFERFTDIAPLDLVKEDYASTTGGGKFTGIPSQSANNIQQIRKFVVDRYVYCDEYFASLGDNGEEPDTPTDKTLSSISATYNGGNVIVGTALTDLTGITVTATYSDGSTSNVTDYELSGTITEGENIITVSYSGKTTTFIVIGESDTNLVYSLPQETTFNGTNYIDTGVQLFKEDKPFTVMLDWEHTGEISFVPNSYVIAHCINEQSPYNGLILQYAYNSISAQIIQGTTKVDRIITSDGIEVNSRLRVVYTKDVSGNVRINHSINGQNAAPVIANASYIAINQTLLLGCYQTTSGEKGRFAKGILHNCKVWDDALSEEEIAVLLSGDSGSEEGGEDTPTEATLTSINATYNGGEVLAGTDVDDLTGITVTATYSDGSTATVTDYTLSGEIVDGENTITVTYNGLTTMFTVTGYVETLPEGVL